MQNQVDITFDDLKALARGYAPDLAQSIIHFAEQEQPEPEAVPEGALTVIEFEAQLKVANREYPEANRRMKIALLWRRFLRQQDPAPDGRYLLADYLVELYLKNEPPLRDMLVELVAQAPLVRGLWGGIKRIYKLAEARQDALIFGAITARINAEHSSQAVSRGTMVYLQRRMWRYLRNLARAVPEAFPVFGLATLQQVRADASIDYDGTLGRLLFGRDEKVEAAWKIAPDPLMVLIETAQHNEPAKFAVARLTQHFPAELKRANVDWLKRLAARPAPAVHELVVDILKDAPEFHAAKLEALGLKPAVLSLLLSPSPQVRRYAVDYAREHATDLPHGELVRYAVKGEGETRKWALTMLDGVPAKTLGLAHFATLLGDEGTAKWAGQRLNQQFDRQDFPQNFFVDLAYGTRPQRDWAATYLVEIVKDSRTLAGVIKAVFADPRRQATQDDEADVDNADSDDIMAFARRLSRLVQPDHLSAAWLLSLVTDPVFRPLADGLLREAKTLPDLDVEAVKALVFDRRLRDLMLHLLTRHATFKAIGLPWLLALARRTDPQLSGFATHLLLARVEPREFGDGDITRGVARLLELATGAKEPDNVRAFAQTYLRCHHPVIGPQQGESATYAIEPRLTAAHYLPDAIWRALDDSRADVRRFAAAVTKSELRRWGYHLRVYELADSEHRECRSICLDALRNAGSASADLACTLTPDELSAAEVFRLTESRIRESRETAMTLIGQHYERLGGPERLAWLMQSADRGVRTMAVQLLWDRHRPTTWPDGWQPKGKLLRPPTGAAFANIAVLQEFLRALMFGLPPGRNPEAREYDSPRRHVSAQEAKRNAIDAACALGQQDELFARAIAPLLMEFTGSIARGEWQACLAALTKLKVAHPALDVGFAVRGAKAISTTPIKSPV
jgi:hypothetical protein